MTEVNLNDISHDIIAFCLVKDDSKWLESMRKKAEEHNFEFNDEGISVSMITYQSSPEIVEELFTQANRKKSQEALIFALKDGNDVRYLTMKENPDPDLDWFSAIPKFALNFKDKDPVDGMYRWGQLVPETGEYGCHDCGYMDDFQAGQVFPICEACLAGEPDGTSGPEEPYWELLG